MCIFGYLILFLFYNFSLRATSYSVEVLSIIITLHSCFALQTEKRQNCRILSRSRSLSRKGKEITLFFKKGGLWKVTKI